MKLSIATLPSVREQVRLPSLYTCLLATVVALALLLGRGHPLQNLNEGVYARVAQEMLETRSFIVPTLEGVPYLEKPPLVYWITAGALAVAGRSEAAARTAPLLGGILLIAASVWFARRRMSTDAARFALAMVGTAPIVLVLARTLLFDLLYAGLFAAALFTLYEAFHAIDERRWIRWSCTCLALAVLAKGLAVLVFYAVIAAALLRWTPRGARARIVRGLLDPIALGLFAAIAVPWHVLVSRAYPQFAWFYFINEHLLRSIDARVPHDYHTGPWWYYVPRLSVILFPWMLMVLLPPLPEDLAPAHRLLRRFLWTAFAVPFVLFSASMAKGDYYLVAGLAPLALLAADNLAGLSRRHVALGVMCAGWLVVIVAAVAIGLKPATSYVVPAASIGLLAVAAALAIVGLAAAARRYVRVAVLACAAVCVPCIVAYSSFMTANEASRSARTLASMLEQVHEPAYLYREFESRSALPFYLDAGVGVVDVHSDDLWYGLRLAPQTERFPDARALRVRAMTDPLWLVVPQAQAHRFASSELAGVFVPKGVVGPNAIYASRPLAAMLAVPPDGSGNDDAPIVRAIADRLDQR